jgi:hypothetical protein
LYRVDLWVDAGLRITIGQAIDVPPLQSVDDVLDVPMGDGVCPSEAPPANNVHVLPLTNENDKFVLLFTRHIHLINDPRLFHAHILLIK